MKKTADGKIKATLVVLEPILDNDVTVSETAGVNKVQAKTQKDNSFEDNKTDNKAPRKALPKVEKAVQVEKKSVATDEDILKPHNALDFIKDITEDLDNEKKKASKKTDVKKVDDGTVVSSPSQKVPQTKLTDTEIKLAQAGLEINHEVATELFGTDYTNYAVKKRTDKMLENAMYAVKLVEQDLKGQKYSPMKISKKH